MKIRISNLRDLPYSTDVENSQGEMIRVLVPPKPGAVDVADIDPFYLNQDKNLRNAVFRDGDLAVVFVPEPDDLVALPTGTSTIAIKEPARLATTANITLSGLQVIDGLLTAAGDRVLVKNQTTASQNGIYVASAGAWARADDANATGELVAGTLIIVAEGATQEDTGWLVATNNPIVIGTTPIAWTEFGTSGITALEHQTLRQLIHFIEEGPGSGFATGAFKEVIGGLFPTSITWWTSAAKTAKIVEKLIDRTTFPATNLKPTPITWRVYDAATGTVVVGEIVDTITYSGAAEVSRTRAVNI